MEDDHNDSDLSDLEAKAGERKDAEQNAASKKGMKNPPKLKLNQEDAIMKPTWSKQKKKSKKYKKRHSFGPGKKNLLSPTSLDKHKPTSKDQKGFSVVGIGVAGIEDMREILDDTKVWYGLMQVVIGTGNFKRTKLIFISFLGEECSAVKRGKASRQRQPAEKALGHSHAAITFHSKEECTFDALWANLGGIFAADNLNVKKKGWSWEKEKIEYEKQMALKKKQKEVAKLSKPIESKTKTPKVKRLPVKEVLRILRQDMGYLNWALFKPTKKKLVLVSDDAYGDGSIPQMRDFLSKHPDKVLYGLVRMAFGVKPYRRTHYVFFHWIGEKTKIVKRGKWNSMVDGMTKLLRPFTITVEIKQFEDMTLKNIILMVKKYVIVDNIKDAGNSVESLFSQFQAAMEEERRIIEEKKRALKAKEDDEKKAAVEEEEEEKFEAITMTISEAVTLVSSATDDENWVLIAPPGHHRGVKKRQYRIHSCENQG